MNVYLADLLRNSFSMRYLIFSIHFLRNSLLSTKEKSTLVAPMKMAKFLVIAVCLEDSVL